MLLASIGRFADEVTATSRKYADEALSLAAKFKDDPAYAAVVYDANMTLSRYALANGDKAAAVTHLREASRVPASDDVKYGYELGANRALKPRLDAGEHAAVVEYLERLAQTSVALRERLHGPPRDQGGPHAGLVSGPERGQVGLKAQGLRPVRPRP